MVYFPAHVGLQSHNEKRTVEKHIRIYSNLHRIFLRDNHCAVDTLAEWRRHSHSSNLSPVCFFARMYFDKIIII